MISRVLLKEILQGKYPECKGKDLGETLRWLVEQKGLTAVQIHALLPKDFCHITTLRGILREYGIKAKVRTPIKDNPISLDDYMRYCYKELADKYNLTHAQVCYRVRDLIKRTGQRRRKK